MTGDAQTTGSVPTDSSVRSFTSAGTRLSALIPVVPAGLLQQPPQPLLPTIDWLPWLIGIVAVLLLAVAVIALWLLLRRPSAPSAQPGYRQAAGAPPARTAPSAAPQPDYQPTVMHAAPSAAPQPDYQPTVMHAAPSAAPQPDYQPTVMHAAPSAAPQPDYQPTVMHAAAPTAPQPDYQPTVMHAAPSAAPQPDYQPTVVHAGVRAATSGSMHPTAIPTERLGSAPGAVAVDRTHPELPAAPTERWVVTVVAGDHAAQLELNVQQVRYSLGRATPERRPDMALHNPRVSREHAWLMLDAEGPLLFAGNATHGTYLGRERAALMPGEQRRLQSGDSIWLSPDVELRIFRLSTP